MRKREIIAAGLGGVMLLAVVSLFLGTHYGALLYPGAASKSASAIDANGLNIPSIEAMCQAAGATSANLESCKSDESAAAEFVIAWMGLHGFVANGNIDMGQIQVAAELGTDPASPLTNPDVSLADPSLGGDPNAAETEAEPNIDPATGLPVTETFDSPAQIAMFCLGDSMDWLQLHDCISRYDPSSRFDGN